MKTVPSIWVLLRSGGRLNLLDPRPTDWDDGDLVIGPRPHLPLGGHSKWDLPLSVAQHSLTGLALGPATTSLTPPRQLQELPHDAEEALIGFDRIGPLKPRLGPPFASIMKDLTTALARRYGLPPWALWPPKVAEARFMKMCCPPTSRKSSWLSRDSGCIMARQPDTDSLRLSLHISVSFKRIFDTASQWPSLTCSSLSSSIVTRSLGTGS